MSDLSDTSVNCGATLQLYVTEEQQKSFFAKTPPCSHTSSLPSSLALPLSSSLSLPPTLALCAVGTLIRWAWPRTAATGQSRTGTWTPTPSQWRASTWLNPTVPPRPPSTTRYEYVAPRNRATVCLWLYACLPVRDGNVRMSFLAFLSLEYGICRYRQQIMFTIGLLN